MFSEHFVVKSGTENLDYIKGHAERHIMLFYARGVHWFSLELGFLSATNLI